MMARNATQRNATHHHRDATQLDRDYRDFRQSRASERAQKGFHDLACIQFVVLPKRAATRHGTSQSAERGRRA
jgi:hypothetical protein